MDTLFAHLRTTGEVKVRAIWQQAEAEVQAYKQEQDGVLAAERQRCHLQGQQALSEFGRGLMRNAEEKGWLRQSEAETRLAERLYELARNELPWLREQCGDRLLVALAQELPKVAWGRLRVAEVEVELAGQLFPEVQVAGEAGISGGLVAESVDGRITVINTLGKRLERAWPQILPGFFRKLQQEQEHAAA